MCFDPFVEYYLASLVLTKINVTSPPDETWLITLVLKENIHERYCTYKFNIEARSPNIFVVVK